MQFIVNTYITVISTEIAVALGYIEGVWGPAWAAIRDVLSMVWDYIKLTISVTLTTIETIIGVTLDIISGHWSKAWNDLKTGVVNVFNDIISFLWSIVSLAYNAAASIGQAIVQGIVGAIQGGAGQVGGAVSGLLSNIPGAGAVMSAVGGIGHFLARAGGGPVDAGTAYLIGEQGPELFVPSVGGTVVPNGGYEAPQEAPAVSAAAGNRSTFT